MKIKKSEKFLLAYFKMFSVLFTTAGMYIGITGYIDLVEWYHEALVVLLVMPFGIFYSFFWIGHFEKNNKILPILLSGIAVVYFYTSWVPGIKNYFDNRAMIYLDNDSSYLSNIKSYNKYAFDPLAFDRFQTL